jgi:hypothetical protein
MPIYACDGLVPIGSLQPLGRSEQYLRLCESTLVFLGIRKHLPEFLF